MLALLPSRLTDTYGGPRSTALQKEDAYLQAPTIMRLREAANADRTRIIAFVCYANYLSQRTYQASLTSGTGR